MPWNVEKLRCVAKRGGLPNGASIRLRNFDSCVRLIGNPWSSTTVTLTYLGSHDFDVSIMVTHSHCNKYNTINKEYIRAMFRKRQEAGRIQVRHFYRGIENFWKGEKKFQDRLRIFVNYNFSYFTSYVNFNYLLYFAHIVIPDSDIGLFTASSVFLANLVKN